MSEPIHWTGDPAVWKGEFEDTVMVPRNRAMFHAVDR
jgi:hypothetical protein